MNKKNNRREILLAVGLIGLLGHPVVTLNGRLLADNGLADRTVAAAQEQFPYPSDGKTSQHHPSSQKEGDVDDTERIQRAVDHCIETVNTVFPSGTE